MPVLQVLCHETLLASATDATTDDDTTTTTHHVTTAASTTTANLTTLVTQRDHATLLHWAAAGAKAREFGCGGHVHVCEYLMQGLLPNNKGSSVAATTRRQFVNAVTLDGNSALHWAAWSGTLETVKLLVRHRANAHQANRNGCTVAHWAASGGNLDVCRYLHDIVGVDFTQPNHGGNTPLTHAVAFGQANVVEWLRNEVLVDNNAWQTDRAALDLAQDFVGWLPTDEQRRQVLQIFQDPFWGNQKDESTGSSPQEEEEEVFMYE